MYGESEKRFLFKGVVVGHSSRARFKIRNTNKVRRDAVNSIEHACMVVIAFSTTTIQIPCDVIISIKPLSSKLKALTDAFEVQPNKISIPPHSHIQATVTFKPPAMQVRVKYYYFGRI